MKQFLLLCTVADDRSVRIEAAGPTTVVVEEPADKPICAFSFQAEQRLPPQEGPSVLAWSPEADNPMAGAAEVVKRLLQGQQHKADDQLDTLLHIALHQMMREIEKALEPDA